MCSKKGLVARRCVSRNARPVKCILAGLTMWLSKIPSLEVLCFYYISLQCQEQVLVLIFFVPYFRKQERTGVPAHKYCTLFWPTIIVSATLLGFWHTLLSVSLDLKTNLCRFLHALLVPAEAEGHQRPAIWKVLPTASAVLPVLDHSCWTHFLGEVDWCSTGCTASLLCTVAFSFSFSSYYILLPFCLVGLNRHRPLLGPETHSL